MPILDIDGEYEDKEQLEEKRVFRTQEEMKTSTLFHKEKQLDTIIQYIRGMKWEIDYFLQLKDVNETLNLPDINLPPTVQKYNRINKLVITLQSAIQHDNIEAITGDAIVNAGFLPNVYDVFIAELTGGRQALFYITEVNTRTYNLHQAYYINFKLHCFLDTEPIIYNDLINKVMKEYTYDKEHLLDYSAPVILSQDYKSKINLKDQIPALLDYYLLNFVNHEKNVIAIPTKTNICTDTMLTDFLFKIVNTTDHIILEKLSNFRLDMYKTIPYSLWDVILKRDTNLLKRCVKDIGFKYTAFTYDNVITKKMNALGINFIANKLQTISDKAQLQFVDISNDKTPDYKPPFDNMDRKYVVSNSFYKREGTYNGLLEKVLMDYLESKLINSEELDILLSQYTTWDTYDQYYGIPILMVLIKDAVSNTFKSL